MKYLHLLYIIITTNKVSEDVEIAGKVFDEYETKSAEDVPSKYELIAELCKKMTVENWIELYEKNYKK